MKNVKTKRWAVLLACLLLCAGGPVPAEGAAQPAAIVASGIAKDDRGTMYIADRSAHVVRGCTRSGVYSVLAGKEGVSGYQNGGAGDALFHSPWDVAAFNGGWAISDTENHVIRFYKDDMVTTLAGSAVSGYQDAVGEEARFNRPTGLAVGADGELYVADTGNHVIRKIDKNGRVTLYAGEKKGCADGKRKNARFCEPTGLYFYKGALYVADSGNHRICRIENGKVTTVAGSAAGVEGDAVGSAKKARFSNPQDIILCKNELYISDTGNGSVKKLSKGKVTRVAEAFSMSNGQAPAEPCGLMIRNGCLYVGDLLTEKLLRIRL